MPTERFYNLPAEKKKLIRDAAMEEFIRVPFDKASINKMIQTAGISRGSFYTYFVDKHDVLLWIFEDTAEKTMVDWENCAKKCNGNLWDTAVMFLDYNISNTKENMIKLCKNVLDSERMFEATNNMCKDGSNLHYTMLEVIFHSIDKSDFRDSSIGTFENLITMIFFELANCLWRYHQNIEDTEKIKKVFREKLGILQYGICKSPVES